MNGARSIYAGAVILLVVILLMAVAYGYWPMLHLPPQGSHLWRQTDCMAMVWNYKLYQLPFLEPATFNLQSDGGRVAGEFPVFYYLAAQCSTPEFALRSMHAFVFLCGLLAVYFTAYHFLKNSLLSVAAALLLFASPLLVFYGNNFLSDVPAWSVAMMGWAVFLPADKNRHTGLHILALFCFAFAALLKASYAFNFLVALLYQIEDRRSKIENWLAYLIVLLPVAWYVYAKRYNAQHHDAYYFLSIFPVWKMTPYEIGLTGWRLLVSWSDNYFWRPASLLLAAGVVGFYLKHKSDGNDLKRLLLLSLGVTVLYGLLFFERLKLHEYYYTFFFVFGTFAVISALSLFQPFSDKWPFRIFLLIFLALNFICCRHTVRQKTACQPYRATLASPGFQEFLNANGCTPDKTVISWYDPSVNQSLYWMKRKGFTGYNDYPTVFRHRQADFLVLSDPDFGGYDAVGIHPADSLGNYQGIALYKLK